MDLPLRNSGTPGAGSGLAVELAPGTRSLTRDPGPGAAGNSNLPGRLSSRLQLRIPHHRRTITLDDFENLLKKAKFLTSPSNEAGLEPEQQARVRNSGQQTPEASEGQCDSASRMSIEAHVECVCTSSTPGEVLIKTSKPHHFYSRDKIHFNFPEMQGHALHGKILEVKRVVGRKSFQVPCPDGIDPPASPGTQTQPSVMGTASTPLNMHKLAPEVVVPLTTLAEYVVKLDAAEDLDTLRSATLESTHPLILERAVMIGNTLLPKGATVHGRLEERGHIRWRYWQDGTNRNMNWWQTKPWNGPRQGRVQDVPAGYAEVESFAKFEDIRVGDLIVLRKGVSFAEICHEWGQKLDDFVSHDWAEPTLELLRTLRAAGVGNCWICTFAVNQHDIFLPPDLDLEETPFYCALKSLHHSRGRVTMCLDTHISALRRIWCIFEVSVAAKLRLPFRMCTAEGEFCLGSIAGGTDASRRLMEQIDDLNVDDAEASRPEDATRIRAKIAESGGMDVVMWRVKRHLTMNTILGLSGLMTQTSATLFALPYVWGVVSLFLEKILGDEDDLQHGASFFACIAAISWQAGCWWSTCIAIRERCGHLARALRYASDGDRIFLLIFLGEYVVSLVLGWAIYMDTERAHVDFYYYLSTPVRKSLTTCLLVTCYICLKVAPWASIMITRLVSCGMRRLAAEAYRPAAPRIGFCVTVGTFCVEAWLSYLAYDPSQDPSQSRWLRQTIFAGLWAWGVSVLWETVRSLMTCLCCGPPARNSASGSTTRARSGVSALLWGACYSALFVSLLAMLLGMAILYWFADGTPQKWWQSDLVAYFAGVTIWAFEALWERIAVSLYRLLDSCWWRSYRGNAVANDSSTEEEVRPSPGVGMAASF